MIFIPHAHDLPPQMGGCWANSDAQTAQNQKAVDCGPWFGLPDVGYEEPETSRIEALHRVLKHRKTLVAVNPADDESFDQALRCALTRLMMQTACPAPEGSDVALRYLRDRISVPRDMSIYAAKRLREALEDTAAMIGDRQGPDIPFRHRRDQDPVRFLSNAS